MSFYQQKFGGQAGPLCPEDIPAEPKGQSGSGTGDSAGVDFREDYLDDLTMFSKIESDVRHFIARSRAELPVKEYWVVVEIREAIETCLEQVKHFVDLAVGNENVEEGELKRRYLLLRDDLIDLANEWELERQRHVDAANRQREEREADCRRLREETEAIREQSHRELSQIYLDLLRNQNAKFKRQQEKLRKAMDNPYYTYELDD